jgi:hypothetical protein
MATTDKKLDVTDLDFDDIKGNLKTFMRNQSEFTDYDFEGSGMSALLDVLAYNTHYLAMNMNMVANEAFLDTASVRSSVVSHAKTLGYIPNSARAPIANVNVTLNNIGGLTSATIPAGTIFNTVIDDVNYQFVTVAEHNALTVNGVLSFSNIPIHEGTYVTNRYTVDTDNVDQKFYVNDENGDTSTLIVDVFDNSSSTVSTTFTQALDNTQVKSDSNVYFLQESVDGKFEVYFGDGVVGKAVEDGNIVILKYVVTNKTEANGASSFTLSGNIGGNTDVAITVNSNAANGAEAESNESIKFKAPKSYAAQDRAVTVNDYKVKVEELYANASSVSAWGGEDNDTPFYGRVYIAIKAASGSTLTDTTKDDIVTQLKKFSVASVTPVIVDPETTNVLLTSTVNYDEKQTTKTSDEIKSLITTAITNYNTNTLQKFDSVLRYSKLLETIDDADTSILSNITTLKLRKSFTPTLSTSTNYTVNFSNALYNPHSGHNTSAGGILSSTGFKVSGDDNVYYFDDDGQGNVRRYYLVGSVRTYTDNTAGTITYSSGAVAINALTIASIENIRGAASSVIELTVTPSSNDIVPVRAQVIDIDVANSTFTVQADTLVGGSANAGIGYTTTSSY